MDFATNKVAPIIKVLDTLFTPISGIMTLFTTFVNNRLHKSSSISVGQLSQALELTSQEDTTQEEHKILSGIVSFEEYRYTSGDAPTYRYFAW